MYEIEKSIKSDNTFYFYRGRVALYAILKSIGVMKGDEVIIQAFTCLAVPNAILCTGASPVYVDIDPKTFNMDISKIEQKITERTKAIIVQHTFGIPIEMDRILEIGKKHNLYIIEDSCHTFASKYQGKEVGLFGDAAFFSFEWGKPMIIGLGGCAIVNNQRIKEYLKNIYSDFVSPSLNEVVMIHLQYVLHSLFLNPSSFWLVRDIYRYLYRLGFLIGTFRPQEFKGMISTDYKKKMSRFHEKLLLKKLSKLKDAVNHRIWVASQYEKLLSQIGIEPIRFDKRYEAIYLRYPLLVKNKNMILNEARKRRIELGDWYTSPIHPLLEKDWKIVGYEKGLCPVAEDICKKIITLPIYKKIKKREIQRTFSLLIDMKRCEAL